MVDLDSRGCLVYSPQKTVALLGVQDLVVVETPEAVLICPRERSQEVKKIVELERSKGTVRCFKAKNDQEVGQRKCSLISDGQGISLPRRPARFTSRPVYPIIPRLE